MCPSVNTKRVPHGGNKMFPLQTVGVTQNLGYLRSVRIVRTCVRGFSGPQHQFSGLPRIAAMARRLVQMPNRIVCWVCEDVRQQPWEQGAIGVGPVRPHLDWRVAGSPQQAFENPCRNHRRAIAWIKRAVRSLKSVGEPWTSNSSVSSAHHGC